MQSYGVLHDQYTHAFRMGLLSCRHGTGCRCRGPFGCMVGRPTVDGSAGGSLVDRCFRCGWKLARAARYTGYRGIAHQLGTVLLSGGCQDGQIGLATPHPRARFRHLCCSGFLVVPFVVAGQREWRTPIGMIIATGDWFAAGSLVVLAIGTLMAFGVYQIRAEQRAPNKSAAFPG